MNTILLSAAILIGAPALKEQPKKETSIVGEWILEKVSLGGVARKGSDARNEFTADGKWIIHREGSDAKSRPRAYKVDLKASPATIDLENIFALAAKNFPTMRGIYKIEGDTLTICYSPTGDRPKSFEPQDGGASIVIMVLKRTKK